MTATTTRELADRYFAALARRDLNALRALLHGDLAFTGPLATLDNADDYLRGIAHITANMTGLERRIAAVEGDSVLQFYDVTLDKPAVTLPVAEWLRFRDGRIAEIRLVLDARPLAPPPAS